METYEALRREGGDAAHGGGRVQGRALLIFKGMATWMKRLSEMVESEAEPKTTQPVSISRLPTGLERHLIDVMVTMALANTRETAT
jgi:hypothetical protein